MGFNYAKEKTKFERQWTAIRKQCEEAGMEQEAIEDLHDFDRDWFKSQRRYITHLVDLPEDTAVEAILQASTGTIPGDIPMPCAGYCYQWLDEIEDERLLQQLMLLSADNIDLLTRLVFEGYTQCEIAQQKKQNQKSISRQFQQIRKTLEKCV